MCMSHGGEDLLISFLYVFIARIALSCKLCVSLYSYRISTTDNSSSDITLSLPRLPYRLG